MSNIQSNINLTEKVLSFRDDLFYNLIEKQCGSIAVEIVQ